MGKAHETRSAILHQALDLASEIGLEGLTIGNLAKRVGMSKSGLYAHFDSKEDLQSQVLDIAAARVAEVVVARALRHPRGLPRVQALFDLWIDWGTREFSGGCPFIAAAAEFDDRGGPVRDRLVAHLNNAFATIGRAAQISIDEGHFRPDLDVDQFAFDFWATVLGYHHYARLLRRGDARLRAQQAFQTILRNAQSR